MDVPEDGFSPFVIGVTPTEGIDYEVLSPRGKEGETSYPKLFFSDLRSVNRFYGDSYPEAYIMQQCLGVLAHRDVKAIRQAKVSVLYPERVPDGRYGGVMNLVSDGKRFKLTSLF